jgi:hypothetical protein
MEQGRENFTRTEPAYHGTTRATARARRRVAGKSASKAPSVRLLLLAGRELLTTQMLINGHPGNAVDGIAQSAGNLIDRELIMVDFKPIKESRIGELAARFEIVLGRTPDEETLQRLRTTAR